MKVLSNKAESLLLDLVEEVDKSPIDKSRIRNINIDGDNWTGDNNYLVVELVGEKDGERYYESIFDRTDLFKVSELEELEKENSDLIIITVKYNIQGEDY